MNAVMSLRLWKGTNMPLNRKPERYVYADNAATTAVSEPVFEAMLPYFRDSYGNPSSPYRMGRAARSAVENARRQIAECLGCYPEEIIFTSGGTEADNHAVTSAALMGEKIGKRHIITTAFEHHAVLNTCRTLERYGFEITYLPVSHEGFVSPEQVKNALRKDTALVSVMLANNEIGTIQPVQEIAKICHDNSTLIHTDAVAAMGNMNIRTPETGADMLSVSGHKLHAPKGIGFLYVSRSVSLPPMINGGGQESGRRSGTENVPAIVGLAAAIKGAYTNVTERNEHIKIIRDNILSRITAKLDGVYINGSMDNRLCGNLNLSFEGIESESLLLMLDMQGISASGGSACSVGNGMPSHVLTAINAKYPNGSLRLTLDNSIDEDDGAYLADKIIEAVLKLRRLRI